MLSAFVRSFTATMLSEVAAITLLITSVALKNDAQFASIPMASRRT